MASRPRVILGAALAAALVSATIVTAAVAAPSAGGAGGAGGAGAGGGSGFGTNGTSPAASGSQKISSTQPNLSLLLAGYSDYWTASGRGDLHGTVNDKTTLQRDDELAVWINRHATPEQRFRALQDSEYDDGHSYDQSITISTGLGSVLGPAYVTGRQTGALPLTSALLNSSTGSSGAFVTTGTPKQFFSHPRPFLPSDPNAPLVAGDVIGCSPSVANGSSQRSIRVGRPYADAAGDLHITRVAPTVDTTHQFSPHDVTLDAGYGTTGICGGGSFPSGHTTTAYQAAITLATLLPELAPEILARASENGNDRIVLGVHYPLDVMGGRISGEAAIAARWSDPVYRARVLAPARAELLAYLTRVTGRSLAATIAEQTPYRADPYGGLRMPGGTAQIVTDRASAVAVYTERMTYGFPAAGAGSASGSAASGASGPAPSVPAGASNLLLTTFPTLTDAQRTSVLAQTEIASGFPLDQSAGKGSAATGSWQRLDLAAAMSATVTISADGSVHVVATGGTARVTSAG